MPPATTRQTRAVPVTGAPCAAPAASPAPWALHVPRSAGAFKAKRAGSAELAVQRAAVDAEDARGARHVAVARVEHAADVAALDLGERQLALRRAGQEVAGRIRRRARRQVA